MFWFAMWRDKWQRVEVTDAEVASLSKATLHDQKSLQEAFENYEDHAIQMISEATSLNQTRVAELLRDSLQYSSRPFVTPPIRSHWADFVVGAVLFLTFIALAPPVMKRVRNHEKSAIQIIANGNIPAFTMIHGDSLRIINASSEEERRKATERFVGHYSITPITKDDAVTENAVSTKSFDLSDYRIIRIGVKTMPPLRGREFPETVELLLSAREAGSGGIQIAGVLLAMDSSSTPTAILALTSGQASKAINWLGSCDLYLLLRP
jgi:hypothetical protein